ncbi:MAG: hypothetical protein ACYTAF_16860, partial [Planctomycetota bacterium]
MTRTILLAATLLWPALQAQDNRLPVPDEAAQKKAEETIREVFAEQYAKKDKDARVALAGTLIGKANETKDDNAARYVMLREARDVAAGVGRIDYAFAAIDLAAKLYRIDAFAEKKDTVDRAARAVRDPIDLSWVLAGLMYLAGEAIGRDDYDTASDLLSQAGKLAKKTKNPALPARVKKLRKDARTIETE